MPDTADQPAATEQYQGLDDITRWMTTPPFHENPYPLYERLRHDHPVYRSPQGVWYLTRYTDVNAALHDPRLSNDRERRLRWVAGYGGTDRAARMRMRLRGSTLSADPPDHTRLRRLISKAFAARRVEALRPRIEAIVADLLDTAEATGPRFDLMAALAYPLPITVICELLGVPAADRCHIQKWTRALEDLETPSVLSAQALDHIEQVADEFEDYLRHLIRARQAEPDNDLLTALVAATEHGDQLSEDELVSTCTLLLATGYETIVHLIGNGALALLRNPDELRRLHDNPTLMRSAVEELLRYASPVQMTLRIATEKVELGGQTLAEGDGVFAILSAANRDPDQFYDPDRLDLTRPTPRHLSFGSGPHFCLGAKLTRLEGQIVIGMLVRRLPTLRLDTDVVDWRPRNPNLHGLASLPVVY